jgi:hypothetical protein
LFRKFEYEELDVR